MKQITFSLTVLLLLVISFACTKKDISRFSGETNSEENAVAAVSVENGVLYYSTYDAFFKALATQASTTRQQRLEWEKQIGFTSIKTLYEEYANAVDALDNSNTLEEYQSRFAELYKKYGTILEKTESDNVYLIKCSGMTEAGIANKDGIVKVGNDVIYFGPNQIVTFRDKKVKEVLALVRSGRKFTSADDLVINSEEVSSINSKIGNNTLLDTRPRNISSAATPSGYFFSVRNQAWNVSSATSGGNDFKGYGRIRLFGITTPSNGIRGFLTVQLYCTAKNWLGITRKVKLTSYSMGGQLVVEYKPTYTQNFVDISAASIFKSIPEVEDYEDVFLTSKLFHDNPSILNGISGLPYNNQSAFSSCKGILDDSVLNSGGVWWGFVYTDNTYTSLISNSLGVVLTAVGTAPFPGVYGATVPLTNGNE